MRQFFHFLGLTGQRFPTSTLASGLPASSTLIALIRQTDASYQPFARKLLRSEESRTVAQDSQSTGLMRW